MRTSILSIHHTCVASLAGESFLRDKLYKRVGHTLHISIKESMGSIKVLLRGLLSHQAKSLRQRKDPSC